MAYTRPVLTGGSRITDTKVDAFLDQIDSLTAPGWTAYTPTWTNTTTNPAIGNGSWTGSRYRRSESGDIIFFQLKLTWGSTTTPGTGSFWEFSFPVAPSATDLLNFTGTCWLEDTSAGARRFWHMMGFSFGFLLVAETGTLAGTGSPWTWATGDTIRLRGFYEPA